MPRVAALLDVMQVSDITKVVSPDTFERPIYAGNAIQTVQATDAKKVITVRTAAFPAAAEGGSAAIETVNAAADPQLSTFKGEEIAKNDRPELTSARIIISGGRSLGLGRELHQVHRADRRQARGGHGRVPRRGRCGLCAERLAGRPDRQGGGAAISTSRSGISGAIQHLAGMKDSKVIVAINKDEEAPIFQVADYGLVGDLFTILPELEEELTKAGQ